MLREAYCLVRDDVASVADIDQVMCDGLGMRWSVIDPARPARSVDAGAGGRGHGTAPGGAATGGVAQSGGLAGPPADGAGPASRRQHLSGGAVSEHVVIFEGERMVARAGESSAAALIAHGISAFRTTQSGAERGMFRGMGVLPP